MGPPEEQVHELLGAVAELADERVGGVVHVSRHCTHAPRQREAEQEEHHAARARELGQHRGQESAALQRTAPAEAKGGTRPRKDERRQECNPSTPLT